MGRSTRGGKKRVDVPCKESDIMDDEEKGHESHEEEPRAPSVDVDMEEVTLQQVMSPRANANFRAISVNIDPLESDGTNFEDWTDEHKVPHQSVWREVLQRCPRKVES